MLLRVRFWSVGLEGCGLCVGARSGRRLTRGEGGRDCLNPCLMGEYRLETCCTEVLYARLWIN